MSRNDGGLARPPGISVPRGATENRRRMRERKMASNETLIVCEEESKARLLRMILQRADRIEHTVIHAEGRALAPQMLFSPPEQPKGVRGGILGSLRRLAADYAHTLIVFDLDFGSPIQPAPSAAKLSEFLLVPAVPSIVSWILADPNVFHQLATEPRLGLKQSFEEYVVDGAFHYFNSKFVGALSRRVVETSYDPNRAAMLSPSLRSFLKTIDDVQGRNPNEFQFTIPGAILANMVLEYYPAELPIYRALDGSVYTGRDMAKEIEGGTALGRKYSSSLLRACRDLLARQAQNARAAE
jgi:hypothetical protein